MTAWTKDEKNAYSRAFNASRRDPAPAHDASNGNSGAAREHRVIAYMQERGFCVWHNSGPNSPFDLCASRNGEDVCRIEVRSARLRNKSGGWHFPVRSTDRCDVYAVVTRDGQIYFYRGGDA